MRVFPVAGRLVRDPRTMQPLPPEGREVGDNDIFWVRRVLDGDVATSEPAPSAPAAKPPAKARE